MSTLDKFKIWVGPAYPDDAPSYLTDTTRDPEVIVTSDGIVWTRDAVDELLATALEDRVVNGEHARVTVDTGTFSWKMTCGCGRLRYAKANTLHEIKRCRVCQVQHRKTYKNESQKRIRADQRRRDALLGGGLVSNGS